MGHADPATTHHQPLVRTFRLDVDHLPKHWFAGNVLLTHAINAQNLFFPTTEQFFVRSVHRHLQVLDLLRAQGFRFDGWLSRYEACLRAFEWVAPSWLCLSVTAAMEHFTASVGECWLATAGRSAAPTIRGTPAPRTRSRA